MLLHGKPTAVQLQTVYPRYDRMTNGQGQIPSSPKILAKTGIFQTLKSTRTHHCRVQVKCDGSWWSMGGEVKGTLVNGVGSQYPSHYLGTWCICITTADAHNSAASSRLNWRPHWFKWTCLFRQKMKSGFCACDITFQTQSTKFHFV
jgi:hypothetical protein